MCMFIFAKFLSLPCDAMHCTILVIVILPVRLSVCLSHSCTVSTWFDLRSRGGGRERKGEGGERGRGKRGEIEPNFDSRFEGIEASAYDHDFFTMW